jgi:hypothetical protein
VKPKTSVLAAQVTSQFIIRISAGIAVPGCGTIFDTEVSGAAAWNSCPWIWAISCSFYSFTFSSNLSQNIKHTVRDAMYSGWHWLWKVFILSWFTKRKCRQPKDYPASMCHRSIFPLLILFSLFHFTVFFHQHNIQVFQIFLQSIYLYHSRLFVG